MSSSVETTRARRRRQASRGGRAHDADLVEPIGLDAYVAAAFLVLALVLGGSAPFVLLAYVPLQLISVVGIGYALWRATPERLQATRPFAILVAVIAGLMAVQLVPLPPAVWAMLPGHDFYARALEPLGLADRWRPWSMTPDLTLQGLLAVLPVMAAAMLFAPLEGRGRRLTLDVLLGCVVVAAAVFVVMLGSNASTVYDVSNQAGGGGLFANRNHMAVFLAVGVVLAIARWKVAHRADVVALGVLGVGIVMILAMLLVLGSRAGLIAGVLATMLGGVVFLRKLVTEANGWRRIAVPVAGLAVVAAVGAAAMLSTRQQAVERLADTGATLTSGELRVANFPAVLDTLWTFFPLGAGFGSFDAVFRRFEAEALLRPSYYNHAHNDLAEIAIEGGVPALLILGVVLVWLLRRVPVLWKSGQSATVMAQAGVLGLAILLFASLADYPLRTPFLGVVFVLLATWVGTSDRGRGGGTWHR